MSNGIELKWQQVSYISNQSIYVLTYTATSTTFDEYIEEVNAMVATLEVE